MTQLTLAGCDPRTLLSHMALYGLAAILEAGSVQDVRLGWAGTANTRKSWARRDVTFAVKSQGAPKTATKALMSPRLSQFAGPAAWELVQHSRWEVLDELTA